ncbi:CAU/MBL1b family subclass B3 metallo-beta-lactamase [Sphingomonas sp. DBB INV C78]|uniref:subclass B3 metallo-beta-lactamase n=1 Tax=Sphingomonas sp. DBB INV C78 TaxID=3349434 RepID=UPI0036D3C907
MSIPFPVRLLMGLACVASPVMAAPDAGFAIDKTAVALHWNEPVDPVRVAGPVYFVGTRGLSAWLITTTEGHILLNSGMPGSGPMIAASIRKLGFRPEDIRVMIAGHAHVDHVGGHAYLQHISGAEVAMMAAEVELIQSGGATDFRYGGVSDFAFDPVKVDRVLRDGDTVKLGNVVMAARLTPGHTRGTTSWVMKLQEDGRKLTIAFPDGTGVNPGYRLIKDPSYPGIDEDYRRTFHILQALKPDIWLTPHPEAANFEAKRALAAKKGVSGWIDPDGYARWVEAQQMKLVAAEKSEGAW